MKFETLASFRRAQSRCFNENNVRNAERGLPIRRVSDRTGRWCCGWMVACEVKTIIAERSEA